MVWLPVTYRVISRNLRCNFLVWIRTYTTLIGSCLCWNVSTADEKEDNEEQRSNSWWFREKLPHVYREISQTWRPNFPAWITTRVYNEVLFAHGRHSFFMHVWLAGRHGICYACTSSVSLNEFETGLYCRRSAAGSHVGPALQLWAAYSGIRNEDIKSCHAGNYFKKSSLPLVTQARSGTCSFWCRLLTVPLHGKQQGAGWLMELTPLPPILPLMA